MASCALGLASLCAGLSVPLPRGVARSGLRRAAMCDAEPMYRPPSVAAGPLGVGHSLVRATSPAGPDAAGTLLYGHALAQPFAPAHLRVCARSGRIYHAVERPSHGVPFALLRSHVALSLADRLTLADGDERFELRWGGGTHTLRWLHEDADGRGIDEL